jgi:hypothetical protein
MFVTEALAGDGTALTDALRARLARLEQLCPGDFAAVKRQTDILAAAFSPTSSWTSSKPSTASSPRCAKPVPWGFCNKNDHFPA